MHLVQLRLASFYRLEAGFIGNAQKMKDSEDVRLRQLVEKHYRKMVRMEKTKYMAPRFTEALKDIATFLGCLHEPIKEDDHLSKEEESLDRDIQTSDSHFSGFSRFSTTNRPSGFALAPPPEGMVSPKVGNVGSTNASGPFTSSKNNNSSMHGASVNRGKQNMGMGQKAD